jgi:isocitrate/isopropylmalate dehydrogenase
VKILILPGDGIGPETMLATLKVLKAVNDKYSLGLDLHVEEIGLATLKKVGTTLPPHVMDLVRNAQGVLLGPLSNFDHMGVAPPEMGFNDRLAAGHRLRVSADHFHHAESTSGIQ